MSITFSTIPPKKLAQGITSISTSFYVNNILSFDGVTDVVPGDLGTQHYICFRNDTGSRIELMEIDPATISTGPISIIRRGLSYYGDRTTEDTDLMFDWSANETTVNFGSDVPQLFQYLKEYIDDASIAGTVPASTSAAGIVVEASQAEVDAGTGTKVISAVTYDLFARPDKQRGKLINDYAADSVGTDAYAITITPAITAYTTGQRFTFKAGTANTGACTLAVSGLAAKTIKKDVSSDLDTGDILANQIIEVEYDGTNMQLLSRNNFIAPTVQTFSKSTSTNRGSNTSRFDITNPAGSTFRYTWDGTGTDPGITTSTFPIGDIVVISSSQFGNKLNSGSFIITGSGTDYFEVTNTSGSVESDKTLTNGYLHTQIRQTYTKPVGLKYAIIEVQGGGANGIGVNSDTNEIGGGAGGYLKKLLPASSIGSTESLVVGEGAGTNSGVQINNSGGLSYFGSSLIAYGGQQKNSDNLSSGGTATGGDINIQGQTGGLGNGNSADDQNGG